MPTWLPQVLKVIYSLYLDLVNDSENRNVPAVLECVEACLLPGAAVNDEPQRTLLYRVKESEVSAVSAAPRKKRSLPGVADLLVQDLQPLGV